MSHFVFGDGSTATDDRPAIAVALSEIGIYQGFAETVVGALGFDVAAAG